MLENEILKPLYIDKRNLISVFDNYNVLNCKYVKSTNSVSSKLKINITEYPRYRKTGRLLERNKYRDSSIIALTLNKHIEDIRFRVCGALIAGAIFDVNSQDASRHADLYYEEIRHMSTDVKRIAQKNRVF